MWVEIGMEMNPRRKVDWVDDCGERETHRISERDANKQVEMSVAV